MQFVLIGPIGNPKELDKRKSEDSPMFSVSVGGINLLVNADKARRLPDGGTVKVEGTTRYPQGGGRPVYWLDACTKVEIKYEAV